MTPLNGTPLVEMRGISKAFGAIQALKDVDLQLFSRARSSASSAITLPASRRL